jgi:ADP-heptose:LPS heptosyltransferase
LGDFADTAALVQGLDAVVTVDTSVAHLAGGVGRPVLMLSRFDACWRWGLQGETTPWYASMRIFRQHRYGDWTLALQQLCDALARLDVDQR